MTDYHAMMGPDLMDPPHKPFSYFANPNDVLGAWGDSVMQWRRLPNVAAKGHPSRMSKR